VMAESRSGEGRAAFYCMSSEIYFLGAVGMINSLRLAGHAEPIFVLDLGLTPAHRELLAREARVIPAPRDVPPWLLKAFAPLRHPADVMVLIDADMIATRPLTDLIEQASRGSVVAFRNNVDRFVPAWGELLDLGPIRRQPYLSSGLVAMGRSPGEEVLRLLEDRQRRVEYELSYFAKDVADYPFRFLDQDVLNTILSTRVRRYRVVALDHRLAPNQPYKGLRLLDEERLRCAYRDGTAPYVVHQYLDRKPWLEPVYHGVYSRLLARLLLGPDVAVRVFEREVPLRMRKGLRARVERKRVDVKDLVRWYARDVIPERIGARTRGMRRRRAAGDS
jgi:hypothetical protein